MRYLRLWLEFLKMSLMADAEFRLNIIVRFIGEFFWYVAQLSVFEVIYLHTNTLYGWDVNAMRLFMATLFLVDCLYMIFFQENLDRAFQLVRKGDLDLYLTKPVHSQFMITFRKIGTPYIFNFLIISGYIIWAIQQLTTTWPQIVAYVLLVVCGFILLYSIRFMFVMITIVLQDAGNIQFIWYQFYRLAMRPDFLYPFSLRMIIFTVLPVAFFSSVPSRILIDGLDWRYLVTAPTLAFGAFFLSTVLWKRALRFYSSASS